MTYRLIWLVNKQLAITARVQSSRAANDASCLLESTCNHKCVLFGPGVTTDTTGAAVDGLAGFCLTNL